MLMSFFAISAFAASRRRAKMRYAAIIKMRAFSAPPLMPRDAAAAYYLLMPCRYADYAAGARFRCRAC